MVTRLRRVVLGADLGKRQTPATIIAVETKIAAPFWDPVRLCWNQGPGQTSVVRWVEAVPLGTSYDVVARRIWEIADESGASEVWMDGTGVGVAVEEMVQHRKRIEGFVHREFTECPRFTSEQIASEKATLGARKFAREFLYEFVSTNDGVFNQEWFEDVFCPQCPNGECGANFSLLGALAPLPELWKNWSRSTSHARNSR